MKHTGKPGHSLMKSEHKKDIDRTKQGVKEDCFCADLADMKNRTNNREETDEVYWEGRVLSHEKHGS